MSEQMIEMVKELIEAESCCEPLKNEGKNYLEKVGGPEEAAAEKALLEEIQKDICSIDDALEFFRSDMGMQIFGETVTQMIDAFESAKANGETICMCPACQAGKKILAEKGLL